MGKKAKHKQQALVVSPRLPGGLAAAIRWPVYDVLLLRDWNHHGALAPILVSRHSPAGKVAIASFLVDLGCLGVKDALVRQFPNLAEYQYFLNNSFLAEQPMVRGELDLAAKIIYSAVGYAANLGFKPNPIYHQAKHLLTGADPDACPVVVPLGDEAGQPLFIAGPYDNVPQILQHLEQRVGAGNFHFVAPLDMVDGIDGLDDLVLLDEEDND